MKFSLTTLFTHPTATFITGAHNFSQVPDIRMPEIAFAGASNAGKSSLINGLIGKKIAITSSTPGRTQQINFFNIAEKFVLADMPGYGYAKVGQKKASHWQQASVEYLLNRKNLKRVFLLVDPKRGLKDSDYEMINVLNKVATSFQIVFTKTDRLSREMLALAENEVKRELQQWPAAYPEILQTSSLSAYGIKELQKTIVEILNF